MRHRRRVRSTLTFVALFVCSYLFGVIYATPDGAAACPPSQAAVDGAHLTDGFIQGELEDAGIRIFIDGQEVLRSEVFFLTTGFFHTVTVERFSGTFRGFLFRLDGGVEGTSTTTAFSTEDADNVGTAINCLAEYAVGGMTHRNSDAKSTISFTIFLDEPDSVMPLDVTIVEDISPSVFYYSQYFLSVAPDTLFPTPSPPTNAPITLSPSTPQPVRPSTEPTLSPSRPANPEIPPIREVTETFRDLELTLLGVSTLTPTSQSIFEQETEAWYQSVYGSVSRRRYLMETAVSYQSQIVGDNETIVVYDQTISFIALANETTLTAKDVLVNPFLDAELNRDYLDRLRDTRDRAFRRIPLDFVVDPPIQSDQPSVSPSSMPSPALTPLPSLAPSVNPVPAPTNVSTDGMSIGLIAGIAAGGAVLGVLLLCLGYRLIRPREEHSIEPNPAVAETVKAREPKAGKPKTSVQVADAGKSNKSTRTVLETPPSSPMDAVIKSRAPPKSKIIEVNAPSGRLGVVIDTPNRQPPTVMNVKESSVLGKEIKKGDTLIKVDGEEVSSWSAVKVTALIQSKKTQPSRKLTFERHADNV